MNKLALPILFIFVGIILLALNPWIGTAMIVSGIFYLALVIRRD
ncbi:hypothetical protein ACVR1G_04165 [Streptococcus dentasini]